MADDSVSRPVGNRFPSAIDDEICDILNKIDQELLHSQRI
jgi:hypothetical protein